MTLTNYSSDDQSRREEDLVSTVLASFEKAGNDRLKELMQGIVRHLHAFIREVRLTETEWNAGIAFLREAGQVTDDTRQEFILLSDVLGASMQVVAVNNAAFENATEATVLGPFFVHGSPHIELGQDMAFGAPGEPCWVEGTVTDIRGVPVRGARIEVWEADEEGFYDVQHGEAGSAARAHLFTDPSGGFRFWGLTPTPYPIPHDGPVGGMLAAVGRSPNRASHLHFMVIANGLRTLVTHIFLKDDPFLATDSVFGVKESLVKEFTRHAAGTRAPDGRTVERSWSSVRFDIVLAPSES